MKRLFSLIIGAALLSAALSCGAGCTEQSGGDINPGDFVSDADYTADARHASYTLPTGETYSPADISVPYINLESADAKAANAELAEYYARWIETYDKNAESELPEYLTVDYETAAYGNAVSIMVSERNGGSGLNYVSAYTYVFDTSTGKRLGYSDFLDLLGLDASDAGLYMREGIAYTAKDWTDADFGGYRTVASAISESYGYYSSAVASDYLGFYIGGDRVPYVIFMTITPYDSGSCEYSYPLAESNALYMLRGEWYLDTGDVIYSFTISGEDSISYVIADAEGNASAEYEGSAIAMTVNGAVELSYDLRGAGSSGSGTLAGCMKLTGSFDGSVIAAQLSDAPLAEGEYTRKVDESGIITDLNGFGE